MKSLAICSQKGGVGKTTLSLNVAYTLAKRERKVLLVDVDPQGSIAMSLSEKAAQAPGLNQLFYEDKSFEDVLLTTRLPNLSIITIGQEVDNGNRFLTTESADECAKFLTIFLQACEQQQYDLILFDTPAGFSGLTLSLIQKIENILIPVLPEPLAVRSLPKLLERLGACRDGQDPVGIAGLVFSMVDTSSEECSQIIEEIYSLIPEELILETILPRDPIILKASANGVPVALLQKTPPPFSLFFEHITTEVENRIGLNKNESSEEVVSLLD